MSSSFPGDVLILSPSPSLIPNRASLHAVLPQQEPFWKVWLSIWVNVQNWAVISVLTSEVQGFLLLIDHRQEKLNIHVPGLKHTTTMRLFLSSGIYDLKGRFSSLFGFGFLRYYCFF